MVYHDLDVVFLNRETLQTAVSALTEDSRAIPSLDYGRRLSVICVEQISAWRLAPWAKKLVPDSEPTTRDSFLESHLLNRTSFHKKDIFANRQAYYSEEDWEPIVALLAPIRRSRGSRKECETYTDLSKFPNLHSLVLDLHYDPRRIPVCRVEKTEESVLLQEAFINAAMDKKLALGIWDLLSSSSTKNHCRLRDLRVASFGHEPFVGGEKYLLGCLSWSFLVTREYNPHNPGSPVVIELGGKPQEIWRQKRFPEKEEFYVSDRLQNILHSIWRRGLGRMVGCQAGLAVLWREVNDA